MTTTIQAMAEPATGSLDAESSRWVRALSGTGPERDDAVERLHALLMRASRFEVARQRTALLDDGPDDSENLAVQAADDALVAIDSKLHTYRGESPFKTWAYKFALLEAGVKVRRRAWDGCAVPLENDELAGLSDAVRDAIVGVLTPHQRSVLVAITLNDVPIDVLAQRRGITRAALYKTLHDARLKLRAELAKDGFDDRRPALHKRRSP